MCFMIKIEDKKNTSATKRERKWDERNERCIIKLSFKIQKKKPRVNWLFYICRKIKCC